MSDPIDRIFADLYALKSRTPPKQMHTEVFPDGSWETRDEEGNLRAFGDDFPQVRKFCIQPKTTHEHHH